MISVPGLRSRRINTEAKYEIKKINNKDGSTFLDPSRP